MGTAGSSCTDRSLVSVFGILPHDAFRFFQNNVYVYLHSTGIISGDNAPGDNCLIPLQEIFIDTLRGKNQGTFPCKRMF